MRLGRYETLIRLGRGGMAEVFAARLSGEAGFARLVAVKRMLAHLTSDAAAVARFLDEARVAAHVTSPHVVQTLDVGRSDDGQPFIVLELVLGVSLAHLLLHERPPPLAVRLELVTQAALGLADVHEATSVDGAPLEIVHRDVSPHNILVGSDGRARLADFGIARANLPREDTRTGVVLGKIGYMPPEQLRAGATDARSDVWAMGAVLWQALSGRPLHDEATTVEQITQRILDGRMPERVRADTSIPPALTAVIERALRTDPSERFANGRELAEALRAAARELGPPVPRQTVVEEVRRVAGRSLEELESVLAELDDDAEERTATLGFDVATVSGMLGIDWDPSAVTATVTPSERTLADPMLHPPPARTNARARPQRHGLRPAFWIALAAGTIVLGAAGAALGAMWGSADRRAVEPAPMVLPHAVPAPAIAEPEPPAPEPSTQAIGPPSEPARERAPVLATPAEESTPAIDPPRERAPRRPRRPASETHDAPRSPLLGADRFDEEAH